MRRRSFNLRRTFSALARRLRPPCTMNAAMASSTRSLDLPSRQVGMANSHREEIRSRRAALHGMACMIPFWRCVHLSTWPPTGAKLLRPGSVRAVAAESLLREQQLLIGNRSRPGDAGQVRRGVGGSVELLAVIADMKRRNPRFSCVRIAQQTSDAFGVEIDKNAVRRDLPDTADPDPAPRDRPDFRMLRKLPRHVDSLTLDSTATMPTVTAWRGVLIRNASMRSRPARLVA